MTGDAGELVQWGEGKHKPSAREQVRAHRSSIEKQDR